MDNTQKKGQVQFAEAARRVLRRSWACSLFRRLFVLPFACCLALGCGDGRPDRVQVTGVVTYNGQPVEGARVTFYCPGGRPASGVTDNDGRFSVGTYDLTDGAVLGTHTATVVKTKPVEGVDLTDPGRMVDHVLPAPYRNPTDSPLSVTVTTDGENDFRLELVD